MKISDSLLPEFDHEVGTTRKVLERVPENQWNWTPHEKSMKMGRARLPRGGDAHVRHRHRQIRRMDFAKGDYKSIEAANRQQFLDAFDKNTSEARAAIAGMSNEDFMKTWSLLNDGKALLSMPKIAVLRSFMMNHLIHHRGQLSVYLRLTNTPVPSIYGPSADEGGM